MSYKTLNISNYPKLKLSQIGRKNNPIFSWGSNSFGSLMLNKATTITPYVNGIGNFYDFGPSSKISCGYAQAFVTQSNGTLWACGVNSYGRLGNNTLTSYSSPVQIGNLSTWTQISTGDEHTLAIQSNGTLWSWGWNLFGQLGLSDTTDRSSPVQVGNLSTWTQITCGYQNVLAIQSNGTLWGWGDDTFGQLGLNTTSPNSSPVQIGNLSTWTKVSTNSHTLAIQSDGTLWSFGNNSFGQLGLSDRTNRSSPVQIGTLSTWSKISCGYLFSLAIQSDGTLWSWGLNSWGQLGLSDQTNRSTPTQIIPYTGFGSGNRTVIPSVWKELSCGRLHVAAIASNGTLWAWGNNSFGVVATWVSSPIFPVQVEVYSSNSLRPFDTWTQISSGFNFCIGQRINYF
jgi:alpha-tubulin suppressor-like RCC1 family protein